MPITYKYAGCIHRVIDADTIDVVLDLGFKVGIKVRCRLARVNAPELNTDEGKAAKAIVCGILPAGKAITIDSKSLDRYGRSIAELYVDNTNLTDSLVSAHPQMFTKYA